MILRSSCAAGLVLRAATLAGALTAPSVARADPLPGLVVERSTSAADCPDAEQLARSIVALTGREMIHAAADPDVSSTYQVHVDRDDHGYRAIVRTGGAAGGEREIVDEGSTCAGLATAVALTLVILMDPGQLVAPPRPPQPTTAPRAKPEPPTEHPRRRPRTRPAAAPATSSLHGALQLGPALVRGVVPGAGAALGASADLWVAGSPAYVGLGLVWAPGTAQTRGPGTFDIQLSAGVLRGCFAVVGAPSDSFAALCVVAVAGALTAAGHDYENPRSVTRAWGSGGLGFSAAAHLVGPVALLAEGAVNLPLRSQPFEINGLSPSTVYQTAPLGGTVGALVRVQIW